MARELVKGNDGRAQKGVLAAIGTIDRKGRYAFLPILANVEIKQFRLHAEAEYDNGAHERWGWG